MTMIHKPKHHGDDSGHWVDVEVSPRRVHVVFGGETIADSKRVLLVREALTVPAYYFPREDVRADLMVPTGHRTLCPYKGNASYWTVKVGNSVTENAAWSYLEPPPECAPIQGAMAFVWKMMDSWYEEKEEILVHPRDPYKRVDVLQSSRHVRVVVAGETVAESHRPRLLFETGHPTRYYLPREDVRTDLLEPSSTTSRCPYKGLASYWSVKVGGKIFKDFVWSYPDPISECPKVKGLVCFFNERVEGIYVDGELLPMPKTRWALA
ncbi:MAG: DUF427 domain-containing protein [Candidatus Binatia bacterium]